MSGAISPLSNTPLWRGAQLKKSIGTTLRFTLTFIYDMFVEHICKHPMILGSSGITADYIHINWLPS
jgi:hypothetical protein